MATEPPDRAVEYEQYSRDMAAATAKIYKARYPSANLEVYSAGDHKYYFVVDDQYYTSINKVEEFEKRMKPAGIFLRLVHQPPDDGIKLPIEEMLSISHDLKTLHTMGSLENSFALRHPQLEIIGISQDDNLAIKILLPSDRRGYDLSALHDDINQLPWRQGAISVEFRDPLPGVSQISDPSVTDVFSIIGRRKRSISVKSLRHIQEDDEVWYPAFDLAARGEISAEKFPFGKTKGRTIFIPSAEWSTLPDLRNYFLLYDHVIMEAPLHEHMAARHDRLADSDYAEAAERGRLQILITQPEERLSIPLLSAIQERSSSSIIGRRASAVFAIQHFANRFLDHERRAKSSNQSISTLSTLIASTMHIDRATAERLLSSPVSDYYSAIDRLRHNDLKALPYRMGEDAWHLVHAAPRGRELPDLELEFQLAAKMTNIGALFGAEVALGQIRGPLSFPTHVTATLSALSVFGSDTQIALAESKAPIHVHPEGPLFAFSQTRPLSELLDIFDADDPEIAHSIMSDLAGLPEPERVQRIIAINNIVHDYGGLPSERVIGKGMPSRYANLIVQAVGQFVPFLGALVGFMQIADGATAFFRDAERLKSLGSDVARAHKQVAMLSRTRKIAWLEEK